MENKKLSIYIGILMIIGFICSPSFAGQSEKKYEVTITNLTRGQIFSPPIIIGHGRDFKLFTLGDSASPALVALAEDGDPSLLIEQIDADPGLEYAISERPVFPGESMVVEISVNRNIRLFSVAGMLVTTNDAFFAARDLSLFFRGAVMVEAEAYDAGSEFNSEDCTFIPGPPCGSGGVHDPTDPEGYVHVHAGIHGIGPDPEMVDPAMHDWRNPVSKITVRRVR